MVTINVCMDAEEVEVWANPDGTDGFLVTMHDKDRDLLFILRGTEEELTRVSDKIIDAMSAAKAK